MPRPGPRPYECVRRAWHSDRHQPIRGSIIQQIFRVVNGSHSTATQGNREWQEKLPIVVFKAEEIMYSKANSEVEYTDLETLWERVNEAINIIIRRDESTETGNLLPPCVEAALNLGCVPVRASRSQRHTNPRSYLSHRNQDSVSIPPRVLDNPTHGRVPASQPLHYASQSIEERPGTVNLSNSFPDSNKRAIQNNRPGPTTSGRFSAEYENFHSPRKKQFISMEGDTSANVGRVYPLHSSTHFQAEVSGSGVRDSSTIIVGTPVYPLITEPAERDCLNNLFSRKEDGNAVSTIAHADSGDKQHKAFELTECDLSLRLGHFSGPCLDRGKGLASGIDSFGLHNSQQGGQLSELIPRRKEFSFFPIETANDAIELSTSTRNWEGEVQNAEAANRKHNVDDGQILWPPEPTSDRFSDRLRWPGVNWYGGNKPAQGDSHLSVFPILRSSGRSGLGFATLLDR